jgi:hypothetical protein
MSARIAWSETRRRNTVRSYWSNLTSAFHSLLRLNMTSTAAFRVVVSAVIIRAAFELKDLAREEVLTPGVPVDACNGLLVPFQRASFDL